MSSDYFLDLVKNKTHDLSAMGRYMTFDLILKITRTNMDCTSS